MKCLGYSNFGSFSSSISSTLDEEPQDNVFLKQTVDDSACVLGGQLGVALHIPAMREKLKTFIVKEDEKFVWFNFPTSKLFPQKDGGCYLKVEKIIHNTKISPVNWFYKENFEKLTDYDRWYNLIAKAYFSRFPAIGKEGLNSSFLWHKIHFYGHSYDISESPLWGTYELRGQLYPLRMVPTEYETLRYEYLDYPRMEADQQGNVHVTIFERQNLTRFPYEKDSTHDYQTKLNQYYVVKVPLVENGYLNTTIWNGAHQVALYFDKKKNVWMYYDNQTLREPEVLTVDEVNHGKPEFGFKGIHTHPECYITVVDDSIWQEVFDPKNMISLKGKLKVSD